MSPARLHAAPGRDRVRECRPCGRLRKPGRASRLSVIVRQGRSPLAPYPWSLADRAIAHAAVRASPSDLRLQTRGVMALSGILLRYPNSFSTALISADIPEAELVGNILENRSSQRHARTFCSNSSDRDMDRNFGGFAERPAQPLSERLACPRRRGRRFSSASGGGCTE